jgi:hypothetical protein
MLQVSRCGSVISRPAADGETQSLGLWPGKMQHLNPLENRYSVRANSSGRYLAAELPSHQ